jgi:hypothetical protein
VIGMRTDLTEREARGIAAACLFFVAGLLVASARDCGDHEPVPATRACDCPLTHTIYQLVCAPTCCGPDVPSPRVVEEL